MFKIFCSIKLYQNIALLDKKNIADVHVCNKKVKSATKAQMMKNYKNYIKVTLRAMHYIPS